MGNAIREIMDERELKPTPFARSIGVKTSTMFSIYRGKVSFGGISVDNFIRIAHGLGMTAEELYYGTPQRHAYADPRQQSINDVYETVGETQRQHLWETAQLDALAYSKSAESSHDEAVV